MTNRLDKAKDLDRMKGEIIRGLSHAQVLLNLLSLEDNLLEHTWKERGHILGLWTDEAESHINTMIDVTLNG